jgi:SAM-dependent methyltransferase
MAITLRRLFGQRPRAKKPGQEAKPGRRGTSDWSISKQRRHAPVGLPREFLHDPAHLSTLDEKFLPLLAEPQVIQAIEQDEVPIPAIEDRENYYPEKHLQYWLSGLVHLREIRQLVPNASFRHVLDFGGATGRIARHIAQAEPEATVTIAELNHRHVVWCGEHFGPQVRAVKVGEFCHFPLADESVSLCIGNSVFTHIDAYETGWLAETHRVLQSGGYAYFTLCTEDTWKNVPTSGSMPAMREDPQFRDFYEAHPTMPDRVVIDYDPSPRYHSCNTFLHTDYVRRVWGKWFEIVELCHGWKTAAVLKKR